MTEGAFGERLLNQVEVGSLEKVLEDARSLQNNHRIYPTVHRLGIKGLDTIWDRHGGRLEISGCHGGLSLIYRIVSVVVSPPRNGTITIIDIDGRFDVTMLKCRYEDLAHVHMFRLSESPLQRVLEEVEQYMVYGGRDGAHVSMAREWVGSIVCGGTGGDIMSSWRGWLKVNDERDDVVGFGLGMSVEEAVTEKNARQGAVTECGYRASCSAGTYRWIE